MRKISAAFNNLITEYPVRKYKKGRPIFYQGEVPRTAFIIKDGVVRVYGINNSGEERIVTFFVSGDIIPVGWVFQKSPVSLYYYDASTDCDLIAIPKEEFMAALEKDEKLKMEMLNMYMVHYISSTMHIYALEHARAQEKLVRILQYLVLRFGIDKQNGNFLVDLRLTHQDLACMVGLSRETSALELGKLKKKGVISYESFTYTVNMPALLKVAGGDEYDQLTL
jgi:CRP/FNR family transcriptional regulator, cyclic AMP receptor protein